MTSRSCRLRPPRYIGFILAALNVLILHDWFSRREQADSWGRFLGELQPR